MTDTVKKRLFDALRACEAIAAFTSETTFAEYEKDLMRRSAVERQLEIIGEALRQADKADQSVADRIAALPEIVALRNRVIHGYDSVDDEIVWDIVQTNIPPLTHQLRGVLNTTM
jgi:uncharacterized protein with HEPN domain